MNDKEYYELQSLIQNFAKEHHVEDCDMHEYLKKINRAYDPYNF